MAFEHEQRDARRILDGMEVGSLDTADTARLLGAADPAFVYLLLTWLRARNAGDPSGEGVIRRIVEVCTVYPAVTRRMKAGQSDPIVEWFEETYDYRELHADAFIEIVVEKLEG